MQVSHILKTKGSDVVTVSPSETASALAALLRARRIGAAVVVDDGHVIGIVSERDIVTHLATRGAKVLEAPVADLMTSPVTTCALEDDVKRIMAVMTHRRIRHLPVVDGGRLAGMVSIGDVVKVRLEETELEINVLRDIARTRVA